MSLDEWSYENEWFEETKVAKEIKKYLELSGYLIEKFNEDKTTKGEDIVAIKEGRKLVVEVKGYPSDKYVKGKLKGQKKPTHPTLQAKHWFSEALLSLLFTKCDSWDTEIALGVPDFPRYRKLIEKLRPFNTLLDIRYYIVNQDGDVSIKQF